MSAPAERTTVAMDVDDDENAPTGRSESTAKDLAPMLYAALLPNPEKMFTQQDLVDLKIIPEERVDLLVSCMDLLSKQHKVQNFIRQQRPVWKVVQVQDAARYKGLSQTESIVFSYIDAAQSDAIWTAHITRRSGLSTQAVQTAINKLQSKDLIKKVSDHTHISRKLYMLAELEPSEKLSGGNFYDEKGSLDESLVSTLYSFAYRFIAAKSWDYTPTSKKTSRPSPEEARVTRAEGMRKPEARRGPRPLPFPPGYSKYPTNQDVMRHLNELKLVKFKLSESEVVQILNTLVWDQMIRKTKGGLAYKSVRAIQDDKAAELPANTNGFTEVPCGRCPVFEWCEDDGPINARTCEYWADWLAA